VFRTSYERYLSLFYRHEIRFATLALAALDVKLAIQFFLNANNFQWFFFFVARDRHQTDDHIRGNDFIGTARGLRDL